MSHSKFDVDLDGRGVIVTGAAGGIGKATAVLLAAAGARVFAVDRDGSGLQATSAALDDADHAIYEFDLRNISAIPGLFHKAQSRIGPIWALAHVAAVLRRRPLLEVTEEDWDIQHDVNLKASFFLNREAAQLMAKEGSGGRIVNFGSKDNSLRASFFAGHEAASAERTPNNRVAPTSDSDVYSASKAGIVSITRSFARAYGAHGVLVNAVVPGLVDTPMSQENSGDIMAAAIARSSLGRLGRPQELASVVLFLCSDQSSYINGAVISVDGGFGAY